MTPTRTRNVALLALGVAVLSWILLRLWMSGGRELPALPWSAPAVMVLLTASVLAFAWPVRRWKRGDRARALDPLRAARTVVLAKASQYCGALLTGWYAAQLLALAPTLDVGPRRSLAVRAAVSLVCSVLLWAVGWLIERWCRVDHVDDDKNGTPQTR
ncbi:DUF3180 domain-containing protein [Angustibacter sp. McL0619]|uniref:DUF3180 domain-containing protein n=1 Tax=Angustibacter sp. McL0619 TaxID=3415676 RepID=UPI003CEE65A0